MLTRKDFRLIADVLKSTKPDTNNPTASAFRKDLDKMSLLQWEYMVQRFTSVCAASNPAFKRHLFLRACGLEDE